MWAGMGGGVMIGGMLGSQWGARVAVAAGRWVWVIGAVVGLVWLAAAYLAASVFGVQI